MIFAARRLRARVLSGVAVFAIALAGFSGYTMWRIRAEAVRGGLELAAMQARGAEDFMTQSLQVAEALGLSALPERAADLHATTLALAFTALLRQSPQLRSLSLSDEQGRIFASSNPANLGRRVATDDHLPQTRSDIEILRVGRPWRGRDFADGVPEDPNAEVSHLGFVPLSRSLTLGPRRLTLLIALNTDHFISHLAQQIPAEAGALDIRRFDGSLLLSTDELAQPGAPPQQLANLMRLEDTEVGQFELDAGGAGAVLTAYRASRLFPFVVVARVDRAHALAQWRNELRLVLGVVLAAMCVVGLLSLAYYRRQLQVIAQRLESTRQLHLAASVFTHAREAIIITAASGHILEVNAAFTQITGYGRAEVVGQNPRILNSGRQSPEFYAAMWHCLTEQGEWVGEIWNRRKNGEVYAEMLTISAVRDEQGVIQQYVALFSDITAVKEHEGQLEHIAHYDTLTGLPNRALLADRLAQSMAQARRRGHLLAVAFLDLDGFKSVNDNHGHDAGDHLLIALAARMREGLREGDTLARLGGDEFVAVIQDLEGADASAPLLARLLTAAASEVDLDGQRLQVSASLGVTFYPQEAEIDADQILRQADQAMYQAKLSGKNRYHVFDAAHDSSIRDHHENLEQIRAALQVGQLLLYYQPKVNLRDGSVVGVEALLRWRHPLRGLLTPGQFLSAIEGQPLAVELGEWVLDQALAQQQRWLAGGLDLPVSVNVGALQLQQPDFVARLRAILDAYPRLRPGDLEIEVLETSAIEDLAHVSELISACSAFGVRFSMDDFGTGYSSLTYLKRLPVTTLKMDQSFVRGMLDDADDRAILVGVMGLARAFHREVIAEGVETAEQASALLRMGCELAQGYGIARPMPPDALPDWVRLWRAAPRWTAQQLALLVQAHAPAPPT